MEEDTTRQLVPIPDGLKKAMIYIVARRFLGNWTMDEIMRGKENEDKSNYAMISAAYPDHVRVIEEGLNDIVENLNK